MIEFLLRQHLIDSTNAASIFYSRGSKSALILECSLMTLCYSTNYIGILLASCVLYNSFLLLKLSSKIVSYLKLSSKLLEMRDSSKHKNRKLACNFEHLIDAESLEAKNLCPLN